MKNLILMTAIGVILFMSRGIVGPITSLYVESLGANYLTIGVLSAMTSLTAIVFSTMWGHLSDRRGQRKLFLVGGLAVLAFSTGLMAIAPTYVYLFPLNIVSAAAQAAYTVVSLALMGDILEQSAGARGQRMGLYRGLGSLGFGVLAFFSGSIADRLSLRTPFALSAGFLVVAVLLALQVEEAPLQPTAVTAPIIPPAASTPEKPVTALPLPPLLISMFLWSLVTGAVYAVWANYMVGELDFTPSQMSRLWGLASFSEFPLMILTGAMSDRIGRLPTLSLSFCAWTMVFLGYVVTPFMPWIVLVQLMRAFAYSAFTAASMTYATEVRTKAQRGRMSGLYNSAGSIGAILGSTMGGALAQFAGTPTMILTSAVLVFCGALYMAVAALQHRRFLISNF
ncbi:MAG TPA: MFS transporter [Anaerolineae bacterium]|nr:MFS transporter [Anaerolineae bacterium]HQH37641.1 MFS transporter [Anaerolineae bacterium]